MRESHLEQPLQPAHDPETATLKAIDACLKNLGKYNAYDMLQELKPMFEERAKHELFETLKAFHACKQEEGQVVSSYISKMKSYLDTLEHLGYLMPLELEDYEQLIQNYNMHSMRKTLFELHVMLKLPEK
ncbi:hypothetical protein Tco_0107038, partial [Tanacetum coccineum]